MGGAAQTIDLSSGLVPAPPPPAAPGSSPAQPIDLSSGLVPASNPASTPPPNAPSNWQTSVKAGEDLLQRGQDQDTGFLKAAGDTAYHIGKLIVPDSAAHAMGLKTPTADQEHATFAPGNASQQTGAMIENIAEFMMGDEALKGLGLADKMKAIAPALKALEKFPALQAAIMTGLRQGTVGAAQAFAHGADPGTALAEGAAIGATGGAMDAAGTKVVNAVRRVAPDTVQIAGEEIPRLASQRPNPPRAATEAAKIGDEPELARTQQEGAQRVVTNTAQQAAEDALNRVNQARQPVTEQTVIARRGAGAPAVEGSDSIPEGLRQEAARRDAGSTAATVPERMMPRNPIVSKVGSEAGNIPPSVLEEKPQTPRTVQVENEKAPNFEPVDAKASAANVRSFGDAADAIEKPAQQVYQKLDQLSKGEFTALREQRSRALEVMKQPASLDAWDQANAKLNEAEAGIDNLFDEHKDAVNRADWLSANSAWKDAKVLDKVHAAVEGSFNNVPQDVAQRTGINRNLRGDALRNKLGKLLAQNDADVRRVIGTQGIDNLYKLADLTKKPETAAQTRSVLYEVGRYMHHVGGRGAFAGAAVGALGGHPIEGGIIGAGAEGVVNKVLNMAATNPRVGKMIVDAVNVGASPKVYAPLIAAEIRKNSDATMQAIDTGKNKVTSKLSGGSE